MSMLALNELANRVTKVLKLNAAFFLEMPACGICLCRGDKHPKGTQRFPDLAWLNETVAVFVMYLRCMCWCRV